MHSGICFTNRPLNIGENIYIRIAETQAHTGCLDFGVTNKNPLSIKDQSLTGLYSKGVPLKDDGNYCNISQEQLKIDDVCCVCIEKNASISFFINTRPKYTLTLNKVSIKKPMWLAFDLWGSTRAIEISNKTPKIVSIGPYFTDEIIS